MPRVETQDQAQEWLRENYPEYEHEQVAIDYLMELGTENFDPNVRKSNKILKYLFRCFNIAVYTEYICRLAVVYPLMVDNQDYGYQLRIFIGVIYVWWLANFAISLFRRNQTAIDMGIFGINCIILCIFYGIGWYLWKNIEEPGMLQTTLFMILIWWSIKIGLFIVGFFSFIGFLIYSCIIYTIRNASSPQTPATIKMIEEWTQTSLYSNFIKKQEQKFGDVGKCSICFEDYTGEEEITFLQCKHFYHKKCASDWLKINKVCPSCRAPIDKSIQN